MLEYCILCENIVRSNIIIWDYWASTKRKNKEKELTNIYRIFHCDCHQTRIQLVYIIPNYEETIVLKQGKNLLFVMGNLFAYYPFTFIGFSNFHIFVPYIYLSYIPISRVWSPFLSRNSYKNSVTPAISAGGSRTGSTVREVVVRVSTFR